MVEDQHLNQAGDAAVLPFCRRLCRRFDLRINTQRHRGGLHFQTLTGHHIQAICLLVVLGLNVLQYAVRDRNEVCPCYRVCEPHFLILHCHLTAQGGVPLPAVHQ